MMKRGHQLSAAICALAVAPTGDPFLYGATAVVAVAFSSGRLSPDVDLKIRRLPHRGPTHTVEYVAIASVLLLVSATLLHVEALGWGVAIGWTSHLLADFWFGSIPSVLVRHRIGTHLKTGGVAERVFYVLAPPVCVAILIARLA